MNRDNKETTETLLEKGLPPHIIEAVVALTKTDNEYGRCLEQVKRNPLAQIVKLKDTLSLTNATAKTTIHAGSHVPLCITFKLATTDLGEKRAARSSIRYKCVHSL